MFESLSENVTIDPINGSTLFSKELPAGDYWISAEAVFAFVDSDALVYLFLSNGDLPLLTDKVFYGESGHYGSLTTSRFLRLTDTETIQFIVSVVNSTGSVLILSEDNDTHWSIIQATDIAS